MAEEKVNIRINTTADTKGAEAAAQGIEKVTTAAQGAEEAAKGVEKLADAVDKKAAAVQAAQEAMKTYGAGFGDTTSGLDALKKKQDEATKATEAASEAKRQEYIAAKEAARALEDEAAAREKSAAAAEKEAAAKAGGGEDGGGLDEMGGKMDRLKAKGGAVAGSLLRAGGIFAAITKLGDIASKKGEEFNKLADEFDATGSAAAGFTRGVAKTFVVVGRVLNPIGAYIKYNRELAQAKREAAAQEKAHRREMHALADEARKAEKELKKMEEFEEVAKRNEEATKAWNKQIERTSRELDQNLKRLNLINEAREIAIENEAEKARDAVDADVASGKISAEEGARKKFAISQKEAQMKEREARKVFEIEQKNRKAREELAVKESSKAKAELNDLANRGRGLLSEEGRASAIADKNNQLDPKKREEAIRRLEEDKRVQESLKQAGLASKDGVTSKSDLDAKLKELEEKIEQASSRRAGIKDEITNAELAERNRRSRAAASFQDSNRDEQNRRTGVTRAASEKGKKAEEKRQDEIEKLSNKALELAGKSGAPAKGVEALKKAVDALQDGATSSEVVALEKLLGQFSSYLDKQGGEKAALRAKVTGLATKLAKLENQMKNNR